MNCYNSFRLQYNKNIPICPITHAPPFKNFTHNVQRRKKGKFLQTDLKFFFNLLSFFLYYSLFLFLGFFYTASLNYKKKSKSKIFFTDGSTKHMPFKKTFKKIHFKRFNLKSNQRFSSIQIIKNQTGSVYKTCIETFSELCKEYLAIPNSFTNAPEKQESDTCLKRVHTL